MSQIETLERKLRDLARSVAVASHSGWVPKWENRFDAYKREVRQTLAVNPDLEVRAKLKILLGIVVLTDVLRGMQEDGRRGD